MAKAIYAADQPPSFLAGWTSRLAVFCVVLLAVTLVLHRLLSLPTAIALNIVAVSLAGAVLSLVMAVVAGLDVWMTGRQGTPRIVVGATLALALLAIPASLFVLSKEHPPINDITTDTDRPPEFAATAASRSAGSNPTAYPGDKFANLQHRFYPDIKPLAVPRPADEAYEIVLQALAKLHYKIKSSDPPGTKDETSGTIEFTDYTLILGFADDIAIRVADASADSGGSIIDVRSASQFGRYDFGANVERIRIILREIVGRLEVSVPSSSPGAAKPIAKGDQQKLKRQLGRDLESKEDRKPRRPAQ